jgi:hypothetical protein
VSDRTQTFGSSARRLNVFAVVFATLAALATVAVAFAPASAPADRAARAPAMTPAVRLTPDANLTVALAVSHTVVDAYETTYFNATAAGGTPPYTYGWNGLPWGCRGGNVASVPCSPIVAGVFNVSVTVTDAAASTVTSRIVPVTVNDRMQVVVKTDKTSGPAPLRVQFDAETSGGTAPISVLWIFGDGTLSTTHYRLHVFTTPGVYNVHLWVNDSAGVDMERNVTITVGSGGSTGTTFALLGLKGNLAYLALGVIIAVVIAVAVIVPWKIHQSRTARVGVRPLQPAHGTTTTAPAAGPGTSGNGRT